MNENKRVIWIDNVKVIAMILVVLCHFSQSMAESALISKSSALVFVNEFCYLFHIQLFFICSGWLFQKYTSYTLLGDYAKNISKKLIALGVPYLFFVLLSHLFKTLFSSYVNNQSGNLLKELFVSPMPPYWFLYVLFLIFLITPAVKTKTQSCVLLGVSVAACVAINILNGRFDIIYAVEHTLTYWIWFAFGAFIAKVEPKKLSNPYSIILFAAAFAAEIFNFKYLNGDNFLVNLAISFLACGGILGFMSWVYRANKQTPIMKFFAKYTMPIFLMHTIFAAGIRSVLFKLGITNSAIHIVLGLIITFIGPIIATVLMEKLHLDFLLYPLKYTKKIKNKKKQTT